MSEIEIENYYEISIPGLHSNILYTNHCVIRLWFLFDNNNIMTDVE